MNTPNIDRIDAINKAARQQDRDEINRLTKVLNDALDWWAEYRPATPTGTLPTWVGDASSALGRRVVK